MPLDGWGRPFRYRHTPDSGEVFELSSAGPDGIFDTVDDIAYDPPK